MGYRILNQALRLSVKLTVAERLVLVMLTQDMADSSATGTPSVDYLAGVCALSVRTVKKALLRLESLGLLERRVGCGRVAGPKKQRTTLYVWNEALAAENSLSNQGVIRRGMATRSPAEQRARYGCLVSEMDDASTPSVLADPDPDDAGGSSRVSRAVAEPSASEAPAEPSRPVEAAREVSTESPEAPPEPPQKPRKAPKEAAVRNPLFLEFKAVYGRVKPAEGAAVEKAWLRVVRDRDPREMRAKAEKLLEKTRDYVETRMREKDQVARVKFTKSPVNFLSDGFWETVPPAPAQPEVGKVYFDEGPRVPLSEQEVYPSWKAAAEGDEAAIKAAKRRMRSGVTVPDAAVVQYPVLIDIFGLECDGYAPEEVQAVFRSLGKPVPGEGPATGADEGDTVPADGGGSLFAELGASMRADMGPAGLEADPADGMSTYDAGRFLT